MTERLKNFADRMLDKNHQSDSWKDARNQVYNDRTTSSRPSRRPSTRAPKSDTQEVSESSRPLQRPGLDEIMYDVAEDSLLKLQPNQLVQALLKLREVATTSGEARAANERAESGSPHASHVNNQLNPLQRVLDETLETLVSVEADLKRERAKVKEAERSRNRMLKELASATKIEATIYDDSHFKEKVEELRYQVYNWVQNRVWKTSNHGKSRFSSISKTYNFLRHTSPSYAEYVGTQEDIKSLIEAHVWQHLGREIFSKCIWAETGEGANKGQRHVNDTQDNSFSFLKTNLRRDIPEKYNEDFQGWRVASARLMALRNTRTTEQNIAIAIRRIFCSLSDELKPLIPGERNSRGLENTLKSAVDLDYLIQQQRPEYMFYPILDRKAQPWFVQYHPESMELCYDTAGDLASRSDLKVRLVLNPGFWKFGDSAGKNFEIKMCLLKTEVDVIEENFVS